MASFLQVKNRAVSALAAGISNSDLSLTVTTGEGSKFPAPGNGFHITIEDEILKCTARSGDVLTVTRAREGTAAAAHVAYKTVALNVTAEVISEIQTEVNTKGDVSGPGSATSSNLAEFDGTGGKTLKDGALTHANAAD
ncbi:hypothetical protein ES703_118437 [subsurface metagenome]